MCWFRKFLEAAGEQPPGITNPDALESYRLFLTMCPWRPTTVIRVERQHNPEWDEAKRWTLDSKFQYSLVIHRSVNEADPMPPETRSDQIGSTEWEILSILLEQSDFWTLSEYGGHGGMDGITCTIEGFRNGEFHSVTRWSPKIEVDGEKFALPCRYLADLGELTEYRTESHN